jgi:hypothetical protein
VVTDAAAAQRLSLSTKYRNGSGGSAIMMHSEDVGFRMRQGT